MKNIITQFSRIFVGLLFIISGLIKLNDPIGFSYKLAEYFSEPVLTYLFSSICIRIGFVFSHRWSGSWCDAANRVPI
jgi:hypothetical protein